MRWSEFREFLKNYPNYTIRTGTFTNDTDYYYGSLHIATKQPNEIQDEYWVFV
jgi:hypothetical protein